MKYLVMFRTTENKGEGSMTTKITKSQLKEMIKEAVLKEQQMQSGGADTIKAIHDLVAQIEDMLYKYETVGDRATMRKVMEARSELRIWLRKLNHRLGEAQ